MLREVQAERKAQEAREQDAIYEVGMCHLVAGKEFSPAEFGFVCSKAEAETLVKRKWTLEHANNAQPGTSIANPAGRPWPFRVPPKPEISRRLTKLPT